MDITAEYIYKTINDNTCIIVINNNVYNITEYLGLHPGGKIILMAKNGTDATTDFNNIQHSSNAIKLLETFKIGTITNTEKEKLKKNNDNLNDQLTEISLTTIKERLVTHEDKFNIHKITGIVALLNMLYRSYENIFNSNHSTYANSTIFNNITLLCHFILAISSLMFHVPNKRTTAGKNFEYKEMRIHSIIFSLRSLAPILLSYTKYFDPSNYLHRLFNILFWHSIVDISTKIYYDNDNGTTIRNSKGSKKIYNAFASLSQIIGISVLLGFNNNKYNFKKNYNDFIFLFIMPIQLSTFLLTLYKKNFISNNTYGIIYGLSIAVLYSQISYNDKQFITLTLLMILLRFQNINKFILYIGFALVSEFLRTNNIDIPLIIPIITFIIFFYNIIIKSLEVNFKDLSLTVLSKTKITDDTYLIKLKKNGNFPLITNGNHIIIKHNNIKRPYTPIKDTKENLDIYIKEYKEGRISKYLANLNKNDIINIDAIEGRNIYYGNGLFQISGREIKTNDCINAICIGTGITPIIRILEDTQIKFNIIHCVRDKKDILPDYILKKTDNITLYNHISNEDGRITLDIIKKKNKFK